MPKRDWVFFAGGGDRVHLFCARCDTSVTILFGRDGIGIDEFAALGKAYSLCHRKCRPQLWTARRRLLRVLGRRPLPGRPAEWQEPGGQPG